MPRSWFLAAQAHLQPVESEGNPSACGYDSAQLPSPGQRLHPAFCRTRQFIDGIQREALGQVEIAHALALYLVEIDERVNRILISSGRLRARAEISTLVPCVGALRVKPVVVPHFQLREQRIVVSGPVEEQAEYDEAVGILRNATRRWPYTAPVDDLSVGGGHLIHIRCLKSGMQGM